MRIQRYHRSAVLGAAVGLVLSSPAWSANKADDAALEEIVITATRSETNLQRTPIAVTALSGTALEQRGVTNMADLSAIAPNVSIGSRGGAGAGSGAVAIRGIGLDANAPASPAVGIYVDEVYSPNSFGNLTDLFDVERIEVLRGPQGTLFGRNTIGGAIQYVTKKPKLGEFNGFIEGTTGELHRADIDGAINVPLGDLAAVRVSLASKYRDGYVHDMLNDINRGQQHSKEGRVQLHVKATDQLSVDAKFEALDQRSNGRTTIPVRFGYAPPSFGAAFAPNGLDQFISTDLYNIAGFNAPDNFFSNLRLGQVILGYAITDDIHLKSISAYQHVVGEINVDQDNIPLQLINVSRGNQTDNLFSQEFQLVGASFDNRLHWTGGLYYYHGSLEQVDTVSNITGVPIPNLDPFGDYKVTTKSVAVYGQATYDLTSKLAVVAGLRYTKEDQDVDGGEGTNKFPPSPPYTASLSFRDTSPLLGLNYQATDDVMLYLKAAKGFRAGGFAPLASSATVFKPETAWTYEAGARMQFLEGRVRVNPTYFHTNWKQVQYNTNQVVPGPFGVLPIIANGPDVKADGIELESQWAVTNQLSVTLTGAWLDARYSGNVPVTFPVKFTLESDLGRAPKSQYSLGALYELPLGNAGDLTSSVNYTWTAKQRSASSEVDFIELPALGLLNARIEYALAGGKYSIAVFGTNLTDKEYINGGTNFPASLGPVPTVTEDVGRPRELGVTLRAGF